MEREKYDLTESAAADLMARYLGQIAHLDMPLPAKIEMISALHRIMGNCVDRAFGDDPVQHVHEMRERDEKRIPSVVSSPHTHSDKKARLSSAFTSPASGKRREERT